MNRTWNRLVAAGMLATLLMRPALAAAADRPQLALVAPAAADVVLQQQRLAIRTLDAAGQPAADQAVELRQGGKVVAAGRSDAEGRLVVAGLSAGAYQAVCGSSHRTVRVWTGQAAPPAAAPELLLGDDAVIRGQYVNKPVIATPLILGGIVAAVIAISLGLDDDDDGDAS